LADTIGHTEFVVNEREQIMRNRTPLLLGILYLVIVAAAFLAGYLQGKGASYAVNLLVPGALVGWVAQVATGMPPELSLVRKAGFALNALAKWFVLYLAAGLPVLVYVLSVSGR
jgi:hypothetical protein